jgi:hypothetical protein
LFGFGYDFRQSNRCDSLPFVRRAWV